MVCIVCLAAAAATAAGAKTDATGGGAATKPATVIEAEPDEEVAFSLAPADKPGKRVYSVGEVVRDGQTLFAPKNMALDANSGEFTWTPHKSQAGTWELEFVVRELLDEPWKVRRTIRVDPGPIAGHGAPGRELLRKWWQEGTAAGNVGDFYDNRDRGHSHLHMRKFPQLAKVEYPAKLKERRLDWALQRHFIFKHVTFGNSSTASGATAFGSNSRRAVLGQKAAEAVYRQYKSSHLYIYPEHRDHDPGRNGRGGHGDLFPANVPYLLTSQGSSGSDRPFMDAVAATLAAFRPEVKRRLTRSGLLMPTIQMIFRASTKHIDYPAEYLTGKAHPTAFKGHHVDGEAMVKMAHGITPDVLPPMVQIEVTDEDEAVEGVDYFDRDKSEVLFDTPCAVARIARSVTKRTRRMVVTAGGSYDPKGLPLKYHWVLLRGDPEKVRIRKLNNEGSQVELLIEPHGLRRVRGAKIESPRVDVGAFVHNGTYYSAPAFVCVYFPPNEARTYDAAGRVREVSYDYGTSTIGWPTDAPRDDGYDIADWAGLLVMLTADDPNAGPRLLRQRFDKAHLPVLAEALKELEAAADAEAEPRKKWKDAEAERKKLRKARDDARKAHKKAKEDDEDVEAVEAAKKALDEAEKALKAADKKARNTKREYEKVRKDGSDVLTKGRESLDGASVKRVVEGALNAAKDDMALYTANAAALARATDGEDERARKVRAARQKLIDAGILAGEGMSWKLAGALADVLPKDRPLTRRERNRVEWFHVELIKHVLAPGCLRLSYRKNYVMPYLCTPKPWRDVYLYHEGRLIGWRRHGKDGKTERFTASGALAEKLDDLGRPVLARPVQYLYDVGRRRMPKELKYITLPKKLRYEYASDADRTGREIEEQP